MNATRPGRAMKRYNYMCLQELDLQSMSTAIRLFFDTKR